MIIRYQRLLFVVALFSLSLDSPAREACGFTLGLSNPFVEWRGESEKKEIIQIKLDESTKTLNDPVCAKYFVTFGYGGGVGGASGRRLTHSQGLPSSVSYNLFRRQNRGDVLLAPSDLTSLDHTIFGQISADHGVEESFYYLRIENDVLKESFIHSGFYSDQIEVRLYSGHLENALLEDSRILSLELFVEKQIDLSLVEVGGEFDKYDTYQSIDFGELSTGKLVQCDVVVVSNSGYVIDLSSQNGGRLKHLVESRYVEYDAFLDSKIIRFRDPEAAVNVVANQLATYEGEHRYRLGLRLGNIGQAIAGTYYDYITVTVSSTD